MRKILVIFLCFPTETNKQSVKSVTTSNDLCDITVTTCCVWISPTSNYDLYMKYEKGKVGLWSNKVSGTEPLATMDVIYT